jgi:hypothetical protein
MMKIKIHTSVLALSVALALLAGTATLEAKNAPFSVHAGRD